MARDLGPPAMFKAAERIVGESLARAQAAHGGDHYAAFKQIEADASADATLAGAIIFLHLGYTLEAINRHEAAPN